jgi:hypothetical protein
MSGTNVVTADTAGMYPIIDCLSLMEASYNATIILITRLMCRARNGLVTPDVAAASVGLRFR